MPRRDTAIAILAAILWLGAGSAAVPSTPAALPDDCSATVDKAKELMQQQQLKAAQDLLVGATATCAKHAELFDTLGLAYAFDHRFDQAQAAYEKALELEPGNAVFRNNLASSYLQAGQRSKGVAELERVLKIDPHNLTANANLGMLYLTEENYPLAVRCFEAAGGANSADPVLVMELAAAYFGAGNSEAGLRTAQQTSRLAGANPRIHYSLAVILAQAGEYARALEEFQVIPPADLDAPAHLNLGMTLSKLQRYDEARKAYLEVIREDPSNPDAYLHIGVDTATTGDVAKAVDWLTQAHEKAPERTDISASLAEVLIATRNFEAAQSLLGDAVRTHPDDAVLQGALGDLYFNQNNFSQAAEAYVRVLKSEPGALPARLSLAKCHLALNQNAQAERELGTVLAADPHNAEAMALRGRLALAADQQDAALDWIHQALASDPHNLTANEDYATLMLKKGKAEEARATLQKLTEWNPGNPRYHYLLGRALVKSGDAAGAQKEFELSQKLKAGTPASAPAR
ncbi:MAG: tetratricopeptide repeat protein [Terriglobia bacterium]